MEFSEIIEHAKNGLGKPNFEHQSELTAFLGIRAVVALTRNHLISKEDSLAEKNKIEQAFKEARLEEQKRFDLFKKYQEILKRRDGLVRKLNHLLNQKDFDPSHAGRIMAQILDNEIAGGDYEKRIYGKDDSHD